MLDLEGKGEDLWPTSEKFRSSVWSTSGFKKLREIHNWVFQALKYYGSDPKTSHDRLRKICVFFFLNNQLSSSFSSEIKTFSWAAFPSSHILKPLNSMVQSLKKKKTTKTNIRLKSLRVLISNATTQQPAYQLYFPSFPWLWSSCEKNENTG